MSSINPFSIPQEPAEDLFGEEDDVQHPNASANITTRPASHTPSIDDVGDHTGLTDDEDDVQRLRRKLEYNEDDEEPPQIPLEARQSLDINLPTYGVPRSSDENLWMLRLPQYLKTDTRPFHPDTYIPPENREHTPGSTAADRSLAIKLEVMNTIRWRWVTGPDGSKTRQSNTRIIKWDDGTMSLQLGKEIYDIGTTIEKPSSSQTPSQSQNLSQSSKTSSRSQGAYYLVSQHASEGVLQTEATITGTMNLRPVGTQSEVHRQLVRAVAQKHTKVSKLRFADEAMVASAANAPEALKKRSGGRRSVGAGDTDGRKKRKLSGYDKRRMRRTSGFSDEDDESEGESQAHAPRHGRDGGEYQEDEFLVADSDEGDDYGSPVKGSKKKGILHENTAMDALEEAEEKLERMAKHRGQEGMDLDDEDEEAEAVRKSSGKRRKGISLIEDSDEE